MWWYILQIPYVSPKCKLLWVKNDSIVCTMEYIPNLCQKLFSVNRFHRQESSIILAMRFFSAVITIIALCVSITRCMKTQVPEAPPFCYEYSDIYCLCREWNDVVSIPCIYCLLHVWYSSNLIERGWCGESLAKVLVKFLVVRSSPCWPILFFQTMTICENHTLCMVGRIAE